MFRAFFKRSCNAPLRARRFDAHWAPPMRARRCSTARRFQQRFPSSTTTDRPSSRGRHARRFRSGGDARRPYFILCLDGGGVRGYLSLKLMAKLEELAPGFLDRVDLFCGTSTGAIVASGLANGESLANMIAFYEVVVPKVFGNPRSVVSRAFRSKYAQEPLKEALVDYFGGQTLGRVPRKLLMPALKVDGLASAHVSPEVWSLSKARAGGWRPAAFTNLPAVPGARPDIELRVVDAILRSAAAPTVFPLHQGYADGGVWANNPSSLALAKAMLHERLGTEDVRVLSVGTGSWPRRVVAPGAPGDLGVAQWSPFLLEMLVDASSLTADMATAHVLRGAYCRLSPHFEDAVALDDAAALPRLAALADRSDVNGAATFLARLLAGDDADAARPRPLGHEALLDGSAGSDLAASALEELVDLAWIDAVGARRRPRTSGAGGASF